MHLMKKVKHYLCHVVLEDVCAINAANFSLCCLKEGVDGMPSTTVSSVGYAALVTCCSMGVPFICRWLMERVDATRWQTGYSRKPVSYDSWSR